MTITIDRPEGDQRFGNLQRLFIRIRLGHQQIVGLHTELLGIVGQSKNGKPSLILAC